MSAQEMLVREYHARRERNGSYSQRAFARALGVSPATLSQVMAGKRRLGPSAARVIAERLGWSGRRKERFLVGAVVARGEEETERTRLDAARFQAIADWHHFAILSLAEVKGARADAAWIAWRLGISESTARAALERLLTLGLVELRGKSFVQTGCPLTAGDGAADEAIRKHHRQLLRKAEDALDHLPVAARDFGAITFAADPAKLDEVRALARQFRREVALLMGEGRPRAVMALTVHVFPLSQPLEEE